MISVKKNKDMHKLKKKRNESINQTKENGLNDSAQFKKFPKKIQEMPKTIHFTSLNPGLQQAHSS